MSNKIKNRRKNKMNARIGFWIWILVLTTASAFAYPPGAMNGIFDGCHHSSMEALHSSQMIDKTHFLLMSENHGQPTILKLRRGKSLKFMYGQYDRSGLLDMCVKYDSVKSSTMINGMPRQIEVYVDCDDCKNPYQQP